MRIHKKWFGLLLSLLICGLFGVNAYAREVPDTAKKGSVSVTMTCDGTVVSGGSLTLYQVGAVAENDGNYSFVLTGDFTDSGISLDDPESSETAAYLGEYAASNDLDGTRMDVANEGTVVFSGLELGLYLIVQDEAAVGYETAEPFLVSVPMYENGVYIYEVDATPKMSIRKGPEPNTPTEPGTPTTPATPTEPTLPQTGQLNWPIPVLAVLGLCLSLVGWALRFGKKRDFYEA